MKTKFNFIVAFLFLGSSLFAQDGFEDFDDIYSEYVYTEENNEDKAEAKDNSSSKSNWIEEDEYYDPSYSSTTPATSQDGNGNTYITNNYYSDYWRRDCTGFQCIVFPVFFCKESKKMKGYSVKTS